MAFYVAQEIPVRVAGFPLGAHALTDERGYAGGMLQSFRPLPFMGGRQLGNR